jgi:hypothetical protein
MYILNCSVFALENRRQILVFLETKLFKNIPSSSDINVHCTLYVKIFNLLGDFNLDALRYRTLRAHIFSDSLIR